ncbi:MAG: alpha/beta hydrolase family protein [Pseudorhodobacter sp.]
MTQLPPEINLATARPDGAFRVVASRAALWFEPGDAVLIVSFDNLATIDTPYPRPAWLRDRILAMGHSILGVQSFAKDWHRNGDSADLLRRLEATGFFTKYRRIVFIGASMGGMGALNLATLVPGAAVIALSAQSTMNREIAPFERRFRWAVRNSDWKTPEFLDAAKAVRDLDQVVLVYDGRMVEDRQHAERMVGPNVTLVRLDHATHEAIRVVMKCGALVPLIEDVVALGRPGQAFWQAMRNRRAVRKWARAFMEDVAREGHAPRIRAVAGALLKQEDYLFARRALQEVEEGG